MKKIIPVAVAFALVWAWARWSGADRGEAPSADPSHVSSVQEERAPAGYDSAPRAGSQFQSEGTVVRVLSDDNEGSRHQRFIVRLASGRTVLVAHNIDLAPRVAGLETGDTVEFSGEFEDNDRGGVVHWTHHDPSGRHVAGWIRHRGRTYQ